MFGKRAPDPARAQQRYRELATGYDDSSRREQPRRLRTIEQLQLAPGACVLDVACGTGLSFAPLHQRVGAAGTIVGVELVAEMAQLARARVAERGWSNVTVIESDVAVADLSAWRFDALLFHYTHDVLQSPAALNNVFGATRPGARVALAGIKTVHPLLWPLNLWARARGWRYRTTSANLDQPWRNLKPWVARLTVDTELLGTAYIATGQVVAR